MNILKVFLVLLSGPLAAALLFLLIFACRAFLPTDAPLYVLFYGPLLVLISFMLGTKYFVYLHSENENEENPRYFKLFLKSGVATFVVNIGLSIWLSAQPPQSQLIPGVSYILMSLWVLSFLLFLYVFGSKKSPNVTTT
jgi:hypothetical protein